MKKQKKFYDKPCYIRFVYHLLNIFYKEFTIETEEEIVNGSIFVGNHSQAHGPLSTAMYFRDVNHRYIWTIGEVCNRKEAADYAMEDFWRNKSKWTKWFYYIIAHTLFKWIAPPIFKNVNTIPVYKDARLRRTFQMTLEKMHQKEDIVIFPEYREEKNNIVNCFQKHFIDTARLYYKKYHEPVLFYPMYVCPEFRKIYIGKPIAYSGDTHQNFDEIREEICTYLEDEITKIGRSLPEHKVVPYINSKRKQRLSNKDVDKVPSQS